MIFATAAMQSRNPSPCVYVSSLCHHWTFAALYEQISDHRALAFPAAAARIQDVVVYTAYSLAAGL